MNDGAPSTIGRSLAVKVGLLLAAGALLVRLGWDGVPDPMAPPGPASVERQASPQAAPLVAVAPPSGAASQRVDVNLATVEDLTAVRGIGTVLAERIVAHRTAFGPYRSLDQLLDVTGIGPGRLARLQSSVSLSRDQRQPPPAPAGGPERSRGPRP